ncbi:MAG: hypothetical protein CVT88_01755 [Candidatus Altiarchaeales archaeon HGW-Altiarchaeales-1]|nr:MAG: hypothetical protein CVT88_01755 [Candidatus Altiarchaeales archaeon HGW-Altiarchaeales-1]
MEEKTIEDKDIKAEILKCLNEMGTNVKNILLFGSRATGKYDKYSDWDFLIVVKENMTLTRKREVAHKIRKRLAEFYMPCDVLVRSEKEVEERKNVIGSIIKSVIKESVPL